MLINGDVGLACLKALRDSKTATLFQSNRRRSSG
jgi:hypothetical protein